jgi:hypothetical protein
MAAPCTGMSASAGVLAAATLKSDFTATYRALEDAGQLK